MTCFLYSKLHTVWPVIRKIQHKLAYFIWMGWSWHLHFGYSLLVCILFFICIRYMNRKHLIDVTEVFRYVDAQKKYRITKLTVYLFLVILVVIRFVFLSWLRQYTLQSRDTFWLLRWNNLFSRLKTWSLIRLMENKDRTLKYVENTTNVNFFFFIFKMYYDCI